MIIIFLRIIWAYKIKQFTTWFLRLIPLAINFFTTARREAGISYSMSFEGYHSITNQFKKSVSQFSDSSDLFVTKKVLKVWVWSTFSLFHAVAIIFIISSIDGDGFLCYSFATLKALTLLWDLSTHVCECDWHECHFPICSL